MKREAIASFASAVRDQESATRVNYEHMARSLGHVFAGFELATSGAIVRDCLTRYLDVYAGRHNAEWVQSALQDPRSYSPTARKIAARHAALSSDQDFHLAIAAFVAALPRQAEWMPLYQFLFACDRGVRARAGNAWQADDPAKARLDPGRDPSLTPVGRLVLLREWSALADRCVADREPFDEARAKRLGMEVATRWTDLEGTLQMFDGKHGS